MRKLPILLITFLLVFSRTPTVKAGSTPGRQPVVDTVLFWTNGCQYCSQTLTTILPALQDRFQSQLSILMIELTGTKDIDSLYAFGTFLGLTKEQIALPFLLIDHTALVGIDEINNKLPGLIENYLARGGVEVPDMPILSEMLPRGVEFASSSIYLQPARQPAAQSNPAGMTLAWIIMVLMVLAVVFAILMILRASQGKPLREFKDWRDILIPLLSLVGLGVSIYLTYVEITHTRALCGPVGDCNAVQSSSYAKLFGFLPVAILGAAGYIAILVAWLWRRLRRDTFANIAGTTMYGMALFGTLFTIYLTYLELFVIHAVCIWCLSSAVIITALMLLNLPSITQWLAISDEED
jgi:uncharacterized membrane protein